MFYSSIYFQVYYFWWYMFSLAKIKLPIFLPLTPTIYEVVYQSTLRRLSDWLYEASWNIQVSEFAASMDKGRETLPCLVFCKQQFVFNELLFLALRRIQTSNSACMKYIPIILISGILLFCKHTASSIYALLLMGHASFRSSNYIMRQTSRSRSECILKVHGDGAVKW